MGRQKESNSLMETRKPEILSGFPDNIKFKDLKLAGVVNSLTSKMEFQEQLLQGFRVFEIDVRDESLVSLNGRTLESVLKQLNQYFILHPREAIFLTVNCAIVKSSSLLLDKLYSLGISSFYNIETPLSDLRGKIWLLRTTGCSLIKGMNPPEDYTSFDKAKKVYDKVVKEPVRLFYLKGRFRFLGFKHSRDTFNKAFENSYGFRYSGVYFFQDFNMFLRNSFEFEFR